MVISWAKNVKKKEHVVIFKKNLREIFLIYEYLRMSFQVTFITDNLNNFQFI